MPDLPRRSILMAATGTLLSAGAASSQGLGAAAGNWTTMSRTERDAAYNNSLAVPGSAGIVEGWTAASARLRERYAGSIDLPYGPRPRNTWDLFPAAAAERPCLVHIHGGYWQARSKENFACMVEGALAAGWSAALPGYTLAPDATLTQIVAEIRAALDWLAAEGPGRGIRGPIVLSGWSAGGHLAAMTLDHPSVKAGFAISGIYELGPLRDTYVNDKLRLADAEVATLSPLRLPVTDKPLVLAYGTAELSPLVENSRAFHAYRSERHGPGALIPVPRANHFSVLEALRVRDGVLTRVLGDLAVGFSG